MSRTRKQRRSEAQSEFRVRAASHRVRFTESALQSQIEMIEGELEFRWSYSSQQCAYLIPESSFPRAQNLPESILPLGSVYLYSVTYFRLVFVCDNNYFEYSIYILSFCRTLHAWLLFYAYCLISMVACFLELIRIRICLCC